MGWLRSSSNQVCKSVGPRLQIYGKHNTLVVWLNGPGVELPTDQYTRSGNRQRNSRSQFAIGQLNRLASLSQLETALSRPAPQFKGVLASGFNQQVPVTVLPRGHPHLPLLIHKDTSRHSQSR